MESCTRLQETSCHIVFNCCVVVLNQVNHTESNMSKLLFLLIMSLLATMKVSAEPTHQASPFAVADEAAFFNLLDLSQPELASVQKAVATKDWSAAKAAWALHLTERTTPRWIWSRRDKAAIEKVYNTSFKGLARYTAAADKVITRDFSFLGVDKKLTHKVEWLQGPIEWTHVLSRFGYWEDLGRAYWGTGKSVYARDFVDLLEDWIASNPVPVKVSNERGPHGSVWRTLEAGIRGQSWFDAMEFFMDAPEFDAEAKYLMTRSLVEHANYLNAWVTTFRQGNWQVSEASGLATIAIMFPELKAASSWRERGLHFLVEHMQRDVEPDGMHWELTPGYHTWVMNEFLKISLLGKVNEIEMPGLLERHEKMFEALQKISRPDRTYPPVGDTHIGKIGESMGLGTIIYHRPDFRYLASPKCEENWLWLFGPEVFGQYAAVTSQTPDFKSILLPNSQYAVMRTGWEKNDKYLLFDCAPWRGGHSHADRLQVTVFAGRDLIVDPGICSYDLPLANELRRSAAHNVVIIDGKEQLQADPKLMAWHTDPQADFSSGRVTAGGLVHQRSVLFVKPGYWVVVDHISGSGTHEVTRLFHFPVGPTRADGNAAQTDFPDGMNLRVQPVDGAKLEIRSGMIATGLTTGTQAAVAALITHDKLPLTLCTVLLPYASAQTLPTVTSVSTGDTLTSRITLTFPDGQRDDIAISAEPSSLVIGSHHAETQALCVRQGPEANTVITIPPGVGKVK